MALRRYGKPLIPSCSAFLTYNHQVLIVPAAIALAIYLLLAYALIPLYRNHYARYRQYLPINTISTQTSTLRDRITNRLSHWLLPSHLRWRREIVDGRRGSGSGEDLYFGEEEGESMVGFDVSRVDRTVRGGVVPEGIDSERRLSRDLEEGFKDDSEDEVGDDRRR